MPLHTLLKVKSFFFLVQEPKMIVCVCVEQLSIYVYDVIPCIQEPFTTAHIQFHDGVFDQGSRLFSSFSQSWENVCHDTANVKVSLSLSLLISLSLSHAPSLSNYGISISIYIHVGADSRALLSTRDAHQL